METYIKYKDLQKKKKKQTKQRNYTFGFQGHWVHVTLWRECQWLSSAWISQLRHSTFILWRTSPNESSVFDFSTHAMKLKNAIAYCGTRIQSCNYIDLCWWFIYRRTWNQTEWHQQQTQLLELTQLFDHSFTLAISLALANPILVGVIHILTTHWKQFEFHEIKYILQQ